MANTKEIFFEKESVNERNVHDNLTHWHKGIELIYVSKGSMFCQTNLDRFKLQKGDICFINRNQVHSLSCDGKVQCEHDTLILNMDLFNIDIDLYEKYILPIIEDDTFSHIRFTGTDSNAAKISKSMKEIESLKDNKPLAYELGIISKAYEIMKNLYEVHSTGQYLKTKSDYDRILLQKMIEYIYENYSGQISLDDIAGAANISLSKANQIFKEFTSYSPIAFLNNYRLEKSAELLRNTNDTIAQISLDCGFSGQSYFNKVFIKEYGSTPLKYRNIH